MLKISRLRAFTLVELLIVITIIGILAAALLPKVIAGPSNARDVQRIADLQQIATALDFYANDHGGVYPALVGVCVYTMTNELGQYLSQIPNDPQGLAARGCPDGYMYRQIGGGTSYMLIASLETTTKTGPNLFDTTFNVAPVDDTYAERIADNSPGGSHDCLCGSGGDCEANGTFYIVGR
ncbi:type II secretion system GspH family protein [Patescibacteria group bacterium]|nr:type II secretion system GspH family protein [Patescibacteria group bacterium]